MAELGAYMHAKQPWSMHYSLAAVLFAANSDSSMLHDYKDRCGNGSYCSLRVVHIQNMEVKLAASDLT